MSMLYSHSCFSSPPSRVLWGLRAAIFVQMDQPSQNQIIFSVGSSTSRAKLTAMNRCPLTPIPIRATDPDFLLESVAVLFCLIRALFVGMDQASQTQITMLIYMVMAERCTRANNGTMVWKAFLTIPDRATVQDRGLV